MADLKLLILGPLRLETADGICVGRLGAKAKALLAYLATQTNGRADREVLANLFWDACPQAEARHSLRQTLLMLRAQLGDYADAVLKSDRQTLQLSLDAVDVDLRLFEEVVLSADDEAVIRACELWRGPFCEGLDVGSNPFEDWLLRERARLDELAATGFKRVSRVHLSAGRYAAAVEAAQRCVSLNPFDDSTHAELIDLYAQRGWIGSARNAYRRCVDLFQQELGHSPDMTVQAAMARALKQRGHHACNGPAFQVPKSEVSTSSLPAKPMLKSAGALNAGAMAFSAIAAFSVLIAVGAFVRDEAGAPIASTLDPATASIAWVGRGSAEAYPRAQTVATSNASSEGSGNLDAQQISIGEAISRALQLDPDYAYLYPAGC